MKRVTTQAELAEKVGINQAYVSLALRRVKPALHEGLKAIYELAPAKEALIAFLEQKRTDEVARLEKWDERIARAKKL